MDADIVQVYLMKISSPKVFFKALFPHGLTRLTGRDLCIGRHRKPLDKQSRAVRVRLEKMVYLVPFLQGDYIPGRNHVCFVEFELPRCSAIHQAAGIDQD